MATIRHDVFVVFKAVVESNAPEVASQRCNVLGPSAKVKSVEASPENIRQAIDFDGTQRLLAHIRQQTLAGEADLPRFHAAWRTVSLMGLRHPRITNSDCGLLRTMVSQAFPRLDVRIAKNRFQCPRGESSVQLKVVTEALLPLSGGTKSGTPTA